MRMKKMLTAVLLFCACILMMPAGANAEELADSNVYKIGLVAADADCDYLFYSKDEAANGQKITPALYIQEADTAGSSSWTKCSSDYTLKWIQWEQKDGDYNSDNMLAPWSVTVSKSGSYITLKDPATKSATVKGLYRFTVYAYVNNQEVCSKSFWLGIDDPSTWKTKIFKTSTWKSVTRLTQGNDYYMEWLGASAMYGTVKTKIVDPTTFKTSTLVTDKGGMAGNNLYPGNYFNATKVGKIKFYCKFYRNGEKSAYKTYSNTLTIYPRGTTLSKLTGTSGGFTVYWKTQKTQTSGYQVQYSKNSSFTSGNVTKKITTNSATYKKIAGLSKGKTYYVRIRTYKVIDGSYYYSTWSSKMKVTTK